MTPMIIFAFTALAIMFIIVHLQEKSDRNRSVYESIYIDIQREINNMTIRKENADIVLDDIIKLSRLSYKNVEKSEILFSEYCNKFFPVIHDDILKNGRKERALIGVLAVFLIVASLTGCTVVNKSAIRPYIITDKATLYTDKNVAQYHFRDANGKVFLFFDGDNFYNVGDTIK